MPSTAIDYGAHTAEAGPIDYGAHVDADKTPTPIADQFAGVGRSLANQAKGTFDTLSSLVDPHMGQKIGDAVIDAHIHEWNKAKEEYAKGNYGAALTRGLGAAVPFLGPLINQTAEKMASGKPGAVAEGATDILAPLLLVKAAEVAPEVAAATKEHVGNFVDVVKSAPAKAAGLASNPKVMATTGAAVGSTIGHATGIPYGGAGGAAIGGMAGKALADLIVENKTMPPPEILGRLNLTAKEYKGLPEDAKAQVRELADRMQNPGTRRTPAPTNPPPIGPVDIGPPTEAGPTMAERIAAEIAARKPQPPPARERAPIWMQGGTPAEIAAPPANPTVAPQPRVIVVPQDIPANTPTRIPLWQRQGNQPANIPQGPANPTVAPVTQPRSVLVPVIDHQTGETVAYVKPQAAEVSAGIHPPPEAFEGTYRSKRAAIIADYLHQAEIPYADTVHLTPKSLTPAQWETLLGKDPETGVQYRIPSQKTIDQARVRLAHKYAAGRNKAALPVAEELSNELAQ